MGGYDQDEAATCLLTKMFQYLNKINIVNFQDAKIYLVVQTYNNKTKRLCQKNTSNKLSYILLKGQILIAYIVIYNKEDLKIYLFCFYGLQAQSFSPLIAVYIP
jgi:hypothetical protein